jgi:hypothetical protein
MGGFGYNALSLFAISNAFGRSVASCVLTLMETGFSTTFFMLTFFFFSAGMGDDDVYSQVVRTRVEETPRL